MNKVMNSAHYDQLGRKDANASLIRCSSSGTTAAVDSHGEEANDGAQEASGMQTDADGCSCSMLFNAAVQCSRHCLARPIAAS